MPYHGIDYLHVVEEAHMQLFVSLLVYIFILVLMAFGTARAERQWEAANVLSMRFCQSGKWSSGSGTAVPPVSETEREFAMWRHRFLTSLQERRAHWQELDQLFLSRLPLLSEKATFLARIEPPRPAMEGTKLGMNALNGLVGPRPSSDDTLNVLLESWFPFQTYLELQSRLLMEHLAEIKATTWLALGLLQLIRAQLLRESQKPWVARMPEVFAGIMAVILFFISVWRFGTPRAAGRRQTACFLCVFGFEPWLTTIHLLQLILCGVCFNIARNGMSELYWKEDSEGTALGVVLGALCLLALGGFLGVIFPRLTMMVAKSEFMRPMHLRWLCSILDDHIFGRDLDLGQMGITCPPPVGPAPPIPFNWGGEDQLEWDIARRRLESWATAQDFAMPTHLNGETDAPKGAAKQGVHFDVVQQLVPERGPEEPAAKAVEIETPRSRAESEHSDHSITFCTPTRSEPRKLAWAELD
jgi:hypothetical protein